MQPGFVRHRIPLRIDSLVQDVCPPATEPGDLLSQTTLHLGGQTLLALVPQRVATGNRAGDAGTVRFDGVLAHRLGIEGRQIPMPVRGTLSSLGVYSRKVVAPYEAFCAGIGDQKIVTTLCPGGKERMRRLMAAIQTRRVDLRPLVTHAFALDDIAEAFDVFSHQRDGVLSEC